jgi:hypothetical protein
LILPNEFGVSHAAVTGGENLAPYNLDGKLRIRLVRVKTNQGETIWLR